MKNLFEIDYYDIGHNTTLKQRLNHWGKNSTPVSQRGWESLAMWGMQVYSTVVYTVQTSANSKVLHEYGRRWSVLLILPFTSHHGSYICIVLSWVLLTPALMQLLLQIPVPYFLFRLSRSPLSLPGIVVSSSAVRILESPCIFQFLF